MDDRGQTRLSMSEAMSNYNQSTRSSSKDQDNSELYDTLKLILMIGVWYISSSLSSTLSKTILEQSPYPIMLTISQFGFISIFCLVLMRGFNLYSLQKIETGVLVRKVLPISTGHIVAHLLTQVSLQNVPVSFTHTVKACSPIFTVILSNIMLGEQFSQQILVTLIPIISGVILSSMTELEFTFLGFLTAMGSTFVFSLQNILSKKLFRDQQFDHINLLFYTASMAFILMLPLWLASDGPSLFSGSALQTQGLLVLYVVNGCCNFGQNIMAFIVLHSVTPLTYSVANTCKRVFVIVSSIIYFGNTVGPLNASGIVLAIGGVVLYNREKWLQNKQKPPKSIAAMQATV
jgi:solute carrier family 35 protein E1